MDDIAKIAADERVRIVEWLRDVAAGMEHTARVIPHDKRILLSGAAVRREIADAIERGAHIGESHD